MLFASILSYSLWVPINLMKTHFRGKLISTISLYLFPQMLYTTLLFFNILADVYCDLISFGLFQSPFVASRYQANNCCSLSEFISQNSRKVRFAMTLKIFFIAKIVKNYQIGNIPDFIFSLLPTVSGFAPCRLFK